MKFEREDVIVGLAVLACIAGVLYTVCLGLWFLYEMVQALVAGLRWLGVYWSKP